MLNLAFLALSNTTPLLTGEQMNKNRNIQKKKKIDIGV